MLISFYNNAYVIYVADHLPIIHNNEFTTIEKAKQYADNYIVNNGFILLTQEQVDKMSILI